ncbi:metalloprotease [Streptomyces olivaceoviridis]
MPQPSSSLRLAALRHLRRRRLDPAPHTADPAAPTIRSRRTRALVRGLVPAVLGLLLSGTPLAAPRASAAASPVCLSGALAFDHRDAEAGTAKPWVTSPARNANWELWGQTSPGTASRLLASGLTGVDGGTFNACYQASGPLPELHMKFLSASTQTWRVIPDRRSATPYSFTTASLTDVATSRNLGTVKVPSPIQGAWNVEDTLNLLYWKRSNPDSGCWTSHQANGACDQLTVVWDPGASDGGYWDYGNTNYVILAGDMPDSHHLVLHEAGHWLQWQLYNHWFPRVTNCNPHYINRSSSTTCAWTEGFADAVAAYVLGDYRFVYPDGTSYSFANGRSTPGWDAGDTVQGRVGSSLLDLWAANGPDGGDWSRTIRLMTYNASTDFREYFLTDRPTASPPLSTTGTARSIITSHTIDY